MMNIFGRCRGGAFAWLALAVLPLGVWGQGTQPLVAIHDSELTRALETMNASPPTPTGTGTTGKQWWPTDWHYFVMPESLKEALRSDGTAAAVVGDSNVVAGGLLTNGQPLYPIVISLACEAMRNEEIAALTNYVAAGGFLMVGSSSFTRNTNGTTRGDFAFANELGLHLVVHTLTNWANNTTFTKQLEHRLISHIPSGTLQWRMPASADEICWGITPHSSTPPASSHDVWQVTAADATVLAAGDNYPYLAIKPYGRGYFIYYAPMQPLIGHGGFHNGMYAYVIFRRAIEWAFEAAALPIPKVSPWPYAYDAAFMVRHDLENFADEIANVAPSAQIEFTNGARGDYFFCTGTLREDMGSYNTNTVVNGLRTAVSSYGAVVSMHNGGLKNPDAVLTKADYDYWHWGPDEALDVTPAGYTSGKAYAMISMSNAFLNIESWLSGLMTSSLRSWVAPYFNATREDSYDVQAQLGVKAAGDQKLTPFPHWTVSTRTANKRYGFVALPTSEWYNSSQVAQSMEWHNTSATVHNAVDFYYGLGALVNVYSHTLSTGQGQAGSLAPDYVAYGMNTNLHPRIWGTNSLGLYRWWLQRSNVQVKVSFSNNGGQCLLNLGITGAQSPDTAVELLLPAAAPFTSLQVLTNGSVASANSYRLNNQLLKLRVGTSVTNAAISYILCILQSNTFVTAQDFDSVNPPALPSGWTSSATGGQSAWVTQSATSDTAPNNAFVPDPNTIGTSDLVSPVINLPPGQAQVRFRQYYNLEMGFDGGVLEIQDGTNAFTDVELAGGTFVSGGYNAVIDGTYGSPIGGRKAWTGNSGGYITTLANLPASNTNRSVKLRWRCATDNGNGGTVSGWRLDSLTISNGVWSCGGPVTNSPPILPAQADRTVNELVQLVVSNAATDPDLGQTLSYQLAPPPAGAAIDGNGIITWTPNEAQGPGSYTLTTVVSDSGAPPLSATNSFVVTVLEVNSAPVLPAQANRSVAELSTLTVTNTASDPDLPPNAVGYVLLNPPVGAAIDANGIITWTPTSAQGPGSYAITTVATDNGAPPLSATNSFTVTVQDVNVAPVLPPQPNLTVNELVPLVVTNAATDANVPAQTLSYQLLNPPAGAGIDTNGVIRWTPSEAQGPGNYTLTTVVTDNGVPPLSATNSFAVTVNEVNSAPLLPAQNDRTNVALSALVVTNTATDSDLPQNILSYALVNPPTGAAIDTNGIISWTPTLSQAPSTNVITTVVTDNGVPPLSATNSFTVTVQDVNVAPMLPAQPNLTVNELVPLVVTNAATDANVPAQTLSYQLLNPPAGAGIDASGIIRWTPSEAQGPGSYTMTTVVTDNGSPPLSATNSFVVTVLEVNSAPVLPSQADRTNAELAILVVTNTASDLDLPANILSYSLVNSPTGAVINANGIITWTPNEAQGPGNYTITTVVTDNGTPPLSATNSFGVVVNEVNSAPVLPSQNDRTNAALTALVVTNTATDSDLPKNTLSYTLVNPPTGALIDANGIITWTPTINQAPSTNMITTVVTDNGVPALSATNSFQVMVIYVPPPPLQLFADNFTRSGSSIAPWIARSGTWTVSGGLLQGSSAANSYAIAYYGTNWTNYTIQAQVQFPSKAYGGGIGGRLNGATGARYAAWIFPDVAAGGSKKALKLAKFNTWTASAYNGSNGAPMRQVSIGNIGAGWHTLALTFAGPQITVTFDGAQLISATDTEATTYENGGISLETWNGSTVYTMSVDNVVVTTPAPLPTQVVPPVIQSLALTTNSARITWSAVSGTVYRLQYLDDLGTTNWLNLAPDVTATGTNATAVDPGFNLPHRFYRVQVAP